MLKRGVFHQKSKHATVHDFLFLRSGVFLTNFEVFDIAMKHSDECLI